MRSDSRRRGVRGAEVSYGIDDAIDFSTFDLFKFDRVTIPLDQKAGSVADLEQSLDVTVHSPGKTVSHKQVAVTVHDVQMETERGSYTKADDGHEYVIPDIEIKNGTNSALTVSTLLQMRVKTGTGLSYTADIMGTSSLSQAYQEGSDIAPGASRRGELAYQVKQGTKSLYFVFDFLDLAKENKAFWMLR